MKKLVIVFTLILLVGGLYAQSWDINLLPPATSQFFIESMWRANITNPEGSPVEIYLIGQIFEGGEEIGHATSNRIRIPPGRYTITSRDITDVSNDWYHPDYEEIVERRAALPAGNYTYCLKAFKVSDGELAEDCRDHRTQRSRPPQLISPRDGAHITESLPTFVWTPPTPPPGTVTYDLKIAEIPEGSMLSPQEAIEGGRPWFYKEDIRAATFPYPLSARDLEEGKIYAWQVTAKDEDGNPIGESEVWTFSTGYWEVLVVIDSFDCMCDSIGYYYFEVTVTNPSANGGAASCDLTQIDTDPPSTAQIVSTTPALPQTISSGNSLTISGYIYTEDNGNPIHVNKIWLKFQLNGVDAHSGGGFAWVDTTCVCAVNCCEDFEIAIEDLNIQEGDTPEGSYSLTGSMAAGPNPMCKIQAEIINFKYTHGARETSDGCPCIWPCLWPSSKFGNFTDPVSIGDLSPAPILTTETLPLGAGGSIFNYSREIIWEGSDPVDISDGADFNFSLLLPDVGCCTDTIQMCIRFVFTDTACITCDTVVGFWFTRCPLSEGLHLIDLSYFNGENGGSAIGYGYNTVDPEADNEKEKSANDWLIKLMFLPVALGAVVIVKNGAINKFYLLLILCCIFATGIVRAQTTPCIDFEVPPQGTTNWLLSNVINPSIITDSDPTYNNVIKFKDDGAVYYPDPINHPNIKYGYKSMVINNFNFQGNWIIMADDSCLCFDYKVDWKNNSDKDNYTPTKFGIYTGSIITDPSIPFIYQIKQRYRAEFSGGPSYSATPNPIQDNKWNHFCLPLDLSDAAKYPPNGLPANGYGFWRVWNDSDVELTGTAAATAWDNIIQNVTGLFLSTDYNGNPSEIVYFDNFCWVCSDEPTSTVSPCNCCEDFEINITSSVDGANPNWTVSSNLTTGPNDIIEIRANLVNFYMNDQPGCERCLSDEYQGFFDNLNLGSIISTPQSDIDWSYDDVISPMIACPGANPRELIWDSPDGEGNLIPRPPLSGEGVEFTLVTPPYHVFQGDCCCDSIWFCIRWTFTDIECITCDTLICYLAADSCDGTMPPGDTCSCGPEWGSIEVVWSSGGETFSCYGGKVDLDIQSPGETFTITPNYQCDPNSFIPTFDWTIWKPDGSVLNSWQNQTGSFNLTLDQLPNAGDCYKVSVIPKCCGDICDSCVFKICDTAIVSVDTCECGSGWNPLTVSWSGNSEPVPSCDLSPITQIFVEHNQNINISGSFDCSGSMCTSKYEYYVLSPSNSTVIPSTTVTNNLSFDFTTDEFGCYEVIILPYCGTDLCDTCYFHVCDTATTSLDTCECGEWDEKIIGVEWSSGSKDINCSVAETIYAPILDTDETFYMEDYNNYSCDGSPDCTPTHHWRVTAYDASVAGYGTFLDAITLGPPHVPIFYKKPCYRVLVITTCDTLICDSCEFYICDTVLANTGKPCECGEWNPLTVEIGGKSHPLHCPTEIDTLDFGPILSGTNITITPDYLCVPDDPDVCELTYIGEIKTPSSVVQIPQFANSYNYSITESGCYTFGILSLCDGEECDKCTFTICGEVTPADCPCKIGEIMVGDEIISDGGVLNYNSPPVNVQLHVDPMNADCGDCEKSDTWKVTKPDGTIQTLYSNPQSYNFNQVGTYKLEFIITCIDNSGASTNCSVSFEVIISP